MRVLLSAYACEPNRGGEPEVGWQRALHMLPFADEVWVLTRSNNRGVIEADPSSANPKLHFIYYDLPRLFRELKKKPWLLHAYFMLWQWGAYRAAVRHHRQRPFDCVYHVTFVSMLAASLMGRLEIPFVIGPIAGGERAPFRLRRSMPLKGRLTELLRDVGVVFQRCNPLTRAAYAAASRIYVVTPDSLRLIPKKWHFKTQVQLGVAISKHGMKTALRQPATAPRFVYIGRLIPLKGVHFAIWALAEARRTIPEATLTLIGSGPYEHWLRDIAKRSGVADAVEFKGLVPRIQLLESLDNYKALIFPSLHDTGGMAVLEAMTCGLPVVCLDLGGPGVLVNDSCGVVIPTAKTSESEISNSIAKAMIRLGGMSVQELRELSQGAIRRAEEFSWDRLTERVADPEVHNMEVDEKIRAAR